jgi:CRP-like cAMP-binding protein
MMGPGEMFGELAILDGAARSATVTAVEPSLLLVLERSRFQSLLEHNAALAYRMLVALATRLRRLTGRMEDAAFLDVPARLVKRLLELAPASDSEWVPLRSRLSQRELGELIGATRESVNKHLQALIEQKAVARRGNQLLVNSKRLKSLLESE